MGIQAKKITANRNLLFGLALFLASAPFLVDAYNTLNQRAFLNLMLIGNPYDLAPDSMVSFRSHTWPLDWPYPPLTILLDLPAWFVYRVTQSESAYQLLFKVPLFASAVLTQILIERKIGERLPRARARLASLYLLMPPVVLLTTVAGGFDIMAAALLFLAYFLFTQGKKEWSALALGLAAALRFYPLLLLPVYLSHLSKTNGRKWRSLVVFGSLALLPLMLSTLPFLLTSPKGFMSTIGTGQLTFGPFASVIFVSAALRQLADHTGSGPSFNESYVLFIIGCLFLWLTLAALAATYVWMNRNGSSLLRDLLIGLLVFFLLYPKVHGLYTISILPIALVSSARIAKWVWVPGVVWMLTVNGAFGASGFLYLLAPTSGIWAPVVLGSWASLLTLLLVTAQMLLIICALAEIILRCGCEVTEHVAVTSR